MNLQIPVKDGLTRSQALCEMLEEMINDGRLAPGDRLDETEIAEQFNVSRTPVREAIRALTAIGLLDASGRQGSIVADVSVSMLIEMFDLMAVLEGMCAQLAARRATEAERAEMRQAHMALKDLVDQQDPIGFYDKNIYFHDLIYSAAHTQFLADQTIRLRRRLSPYRRRVTFQPGRMRASIEEHEAILDAIDDGDADRAMDAARSHLRLLGSQLEDFIASLQVGMKA